MENIVKNSIRSLAEHLMKKEKAFPFYLQIKELDGVKVCISLCANMSLTSDQYMCILIESVFERDENDECSNIRCFNKYDSEILIHKNKIEWTTEMMEESIVSIQSLLGKLKYDKFANTFNVELNPMSKIQNDIWSVNKNTKMCGDTCCVCLEMTTSMTECDHAVCLQCWSQLKKVEGDGGRGYGNNCPMCRRFMPIYLN